MSIQEYNSLGETLIIVMNNYLPSEQHMLQFLSGKILDVFYDEFIRKKEKIGRLKIVSAVIKYRWSAVEFCTSILVITTKF